MNDKAKTVVITGAASGIGLACARMFSAEGWRVVGIDVDAGEFVEFKCDLAEHSSTLALAKTISEQHATKLAGLVHAAARMVPHTLSSSDAGELLHTYEVNVVALYRLLDTFKDVLKANRASVVALSSVHAQHTSLGALAYATSKAALEGFVRASALELAPEVNVNAIAPGAIDTPMLAAGMARHLADGESAESRLEALIDSTPQKRIASPDEIAQMVYFMINSASFMTGEIVTVDGGVTAKLASE